MNQSGQQTSDAPSHLTVRDANCEYASEAQKKKKLKSIWGHKERLRFEQWLKPVINITLKIVFLH